MEKITITPNQIRGLGDITEPKTTNDFTGDTIYQSSSIIGGVETPIFSFNNDSISIEASNPYMVSGEDTDLTITLRNGLGEPLTNKTITVTGTDSSSYSGITNDNGIFTLYDITVSADTTFTATYSTVTDSCLVEFCDFVDYAVTGAKNSNWTNYSNRITVATDTNGTTLTGTASNSTGYYLVNNTSYEFTDYIVEFDVLSITDSVGWYVQADTSHTQIIVTSLSSYGATANAHMKIVCEDGAIDIYANGVKKTSTPITVTPTPPLTVGFRVYYNKSMKYRNLRIHKL